MRISVRYDPEKHHRRSIRVRGYDYASSGAYFLTICTYQRQCLFGEVINGKVVLNEFGKIAAAEWMKSCDIRQEISFGEWTIMPNHMHGIVVIHQSGQSEQTTGFQNCVSRPRQTSDRRPRSLSTLVSGFKSAVTIRINHSRDTTGAPVWQRNYYEHIIRDDASFCYIQKYILDNPLTWQNDQLHPNNPSKW